MFAFPGTGRWVTIAAAALGLAQTARAQGCVMCYTSASALNKSGIRALDKGIIVLFLPPVLIFAGILFFIYRRRHAWIAERRQDEFVPESAWHRIHPVH